MFPAATPGIQGHARSQFMPTTDIPHSRHPLQGGAIVATVAFFSCKILRWKFNQARRMDGEWTKVSEADFDVCVAPVSGREIAGCADSREPNDRYSGDAAIFERVTSSRFLPSIRISRVGAVRFGECTSPTS